MVEWRKVKREVLRVWHQGVDQVSKPFDKSAQKRYDANFSTITQIIDGTASVSAKMAILFIYQPDTFSRSILVTCKFLQDQGYSVLLVSSTPINASDIELLRNLTWKILLRPNYGYDFGGYRDGIRVLGDFGVKPERLIIMNDSIWFPLFETTNLIDRLESENLAFNGPVRINSDHRATSHRHIQSYFFLLRREAIESDAFQRFWETYRISSKKRIVLHNGEKGFSQAMFKGGFGGGRRDTRVDLLALLEKQSNDSIVKIMRYSAYPTAEFATEGRSVLADFSDTNAWRQQALAHLGKVLSKCGLVGVNAYANAKLLDFSFLKKRSLSAVYDGMRWQYLRAVQNGDLPPPHPDILAEIMASKMDGRFTTDPSIPVPVSATKAR